MESAKRINIPSLTNIGESVEGDGCDDSHTLVSPLLGESLDVLDDSGLRQLIENAQVEFATRLEEEQSTAEFGDITAGQFTENVTLWMMPSTWGVGIELDTFKGCCASEWGTESYWIGC